MDLVLSVDKVEAHVLKIPMLDDQLIVAASGTVPTSGWTAPRLSPYFYFRPPADGIWDFDFIADPPSGIVLDVVLPISVFFSGEKPDWCQGVRIHAKNGNLEDKLSINKTAVRAGLSSSMLMAAANRYSQQLGVYDDSFQPTGGVKVEGFPPLPHFEWKKLRHEIWISVDAPDEAKIRRCIDEALRAAVGVALLSAIATGGIGLSAAISAFLGYLETCIGTQAIKIDDRSHWIYWWT